MGAVHDFGSLVVSVREKGRSIADITDGVISGRARIMFLCFVLVLAWLVLAVFAMVIAGLFVMTPTAVLPINIEIPIARIGFLPEGDVQAASLTFYVSIRSAEGDAGKVQKIPFHLAIPDEKMEEARASSAHYPLPLVLRQGDRQVAIGIRDGVSRLFSAIRLDLTQHSQF